MTLEGWSRKTIGDLCNFSNGYGFRPPDWSKEGLPIIRIQNLNGSKEFNYFSGVPDESWIIEPGTILFAWAGTRGVSFGPTIWNGPRGVLNQHIFRVQPFEDINPLWLYAALEAATSNIERKAHGFKATLLHVRKEEITRQIVYTPLPLEQQRIVDILSTWDRAIDLATQLIATKQQYKRGLVQQLLTGKRRFETFANQPWPLLKAGDIFQTYSKRNNGSEELLSVTQDRGVVPRSMLDTRVVMPANETESYKLVEPGDFIISLRSFQGGIEYSQYKGLVSPAYTVLKPKQPIVDSFYKHLYKSQNFISHLGVAIIGIRDGKQINFEDFATIRLPYPILEEQKRIAEVLDTCDHELSLLNRKLELLKKQKQGLMQQLLTGKVRVKT
jgi:type I restriction enzyme, S subunit